MLLVEELPAVTMRCLAELFSLLEIGEQAILKDLQGHPWGVAVSQHSWANDRCAWPHHWNLMPSYTEA